MFKHEINLQELKIFFSFKGRLVNHDVNAITLFGKRHVNSTSHVL